MIFLFFPQKIKCIEFIHSFLCISDLLKEVEMGEVKKTCHAEQASGTTALGGPGNVQHKRLCIQAHKASSRRPDQPEFP